MCGIAGLLDIGHQPIKGLKPKLKKMTDSIAHRGPDGEGFWTSEDASVGFGHRRLSIVDLSKNGSQPMCNEDKSIWIVFNGEIYNHADIRPELEKLGHVYHSHTDTETIIHAYEEWGEKCLERFRGMFSFAIWDENMQELFFARDRIGVKPFYYTTYNGQFFFGSEVKPLLATGDVPRIMDEEALYHYLTFFVSPAPRTLFKDIFKLKAGHWGKITKKGQLNIKQYWDAVSTEDTIKTREEWHEEILGTLSESVKLRMMSDVPFGAYLSGGVDSSAITVLMNGLMDRPIDTFTTAFSDDPELDESQFAKQIAKTYHTAYHGQILKNKDFYAFYSKLVFYQDDPASDWVSFPLYFVSKLIHDNKVVVAQVGEGSDELFCGYTGYVQFLQLNKLYQKLLRLPKPVRFFIYGVTKAAFKVKPARFLPEFGRRLAAGEELFWGAAIAFTETEKDQLLGPKLRRKFHSHHIVKELYEQFDKKCPGRDQLARMTYLELKSRLAELLLMRVDRMGMASSIEARVPFLDHIFVEKMLQLPTVLKTEGGTKTVLKEALRGTIPDNIIDRKKLGFHAPVAHWLRTDEQFRKFLYNKIMTSPLIQENLIQAVYVERLFKLHLAGKADCSVQLWCLMTICGWHERWIEPKVLTFSQP